MGELKMKDSKGTNDHRNDIMIRSVKLPEFPPSSLQSPPSSFFPSQTLSAPGNFGLIKCDERCQ